MGRPLTERERALLTDTLELMRTGHHETLGPWQDRHGNEVIPKQKPIPADPEPYLSQLSALRVEQESGCSQNCYSCNRRPSRQPCRTVFFVTEEERSSFADDINGGSGDMVAEQVTDDGLMVLVFANAGRLTELETC